MDIDLGNFDAFGIKAVMLSDGKWYAVKGHLGRTSRLGLTTAVEFMTLSADSINSQGSPARVVVGCAEVRAVSYGAVPVSLETGS